MVLRLGDFKAPIGTEGCLFLCYCFMANLRNDAQVYKAYDYSVHQGWLAASSCYTNVVADTVIDGLCNYFGTTRMTNVSRYQVTSDRWVVVNAFGETVYDAEYGLSETNSLDSRAIHIKINVNDIVNQIGGFFSGRKFHKVSGDKKQVDGGIWITGQADDVLFSAYYHPKKSHCCQVQPGKDADVVPIIKQWVGAGEWAIAYCVTEAEEGNVGFYEIEEEKEEQEEKNDFSPCDICMKTCNRSGKTVEQCEHMCEMACESRNELDSRAIHIKINVNDIVNQIGGFFSGRKFHKVTGDKKKVDGGIWITGQADDVLFSAYYHPKKSHCCQVQPGKDADVVPIIKQWVGAGEWAIAYCVTEAEEGNVGFYEIEEEKEEQEEKNDFSPCDICMKTYSKSGKSEEQCEDMCEMACESRNELDSRAIHIKINVNDIANQIASFFGRKFHKVTGDKKKVDGGIWITGQADDVLFSAYYHPKKSHCCQVQPGKDAEPVPTVKEWVKGGEWAIAYCMTTAAEGNVGLYEIEEEKEEKNDFSPCDICMKTCSKSGKSEEQCEEQCEKICESRNGLDSRAIHIKINVNDIINQIGGMLGGRSFIDKKATKKMVDGGVWISGKADNVIFSAYYHDKKEHCCQVQPGKDAAAVPVVKRWAKPGEWAIEYVVTTAKEGNKAMYELAEEAEEEENGFNKCDICLKSCIASGKDEEECKKRCGKVCKAKNDFSPCEICKKACNKSGKSEEKCEAICGNACKAAESNDMDTRAIHIKINVNDVIDQIGKLMGRNLVDRQATKKMADGGIWVSGKADDVIFSAYYHKDKAHCASVRPGTESAVLPVNKEWVAPGKWAIAYSVSTATSGNKALYEVAEGA